MRGPAAPDPRTPVIVGAGQLNLDGGDSPEPVELLAEASRRALADTGSARVLGALESVRVIRMLSRRYLDPGAVVARLIGARPRHTAVTTVGGQSPQALVDRSAMQIRQGSLDVALIGGAESWKTRTRYQARGERPPWSTPPGERPPDEVIGSELSMVAEEESRLGLLLPTQFYPLFESALRARSGRSVADHGLDVATLWAAFSRVASANPNAAIRRAMSASEIATPGPDNRMVGFPYTKLMNSNASVDQAAALVMCSAERARALGVPRDRWVFLHGAAEAADTPLVSNRAELWSSPAIRLAGQRALELSGFGVGDLAHVDLYSCFPSAVQVAAAELGLSVDRDLTVTGGLTFAGGPWNNYVTHAIATMVRLLRQDPDSVGLCSANGGLLTKHAIGVYSARPPAEGTRVEDVQGQVDALPSRRVVPDFDGPATIEAYTVMHDREGRPETAFLACRVDTTEGVAAAPGWAGAGEPELLAAMTTEEFVGRPVVLRDGSVLKVP
ncbi:MAG: acetyl-CoA acetyltransferase [Acidimicrobiales bacterium]